MEKFFQYPVKHEFVVKKDYSFVINENSDVAFKILEDPTASKARYIAACINACKDIDTETLESGAPGWIAEKLGDGERAAEFMKTITQLQSDGIGMANLQNLLNAANAENERLQKQVELLVESQQVSNLAEKINTQYKDTETESALNELHAFGQKMYDALCEAHRIQVGRNGFFDSDLIEQGQRFFKQQAQPKGIKTLADLRKEISEVPTYFDTQKVSLVDGILQLGEYQNKPAYFVGTENGIEDTDAPPNNGGYTEEDERYKVFFGEYPDTFKTSNLKNG